MVKINLPQKVAAAPQLFFYLCTVLIFIELPGSLDIMISPVLIKAAC